MSQLDDAALNEAFAELGLGEPAEVAPVQPDDASVVEGTPTEPQQTEQQPEAPAEGQARDEQGRFVAKEQPEEEQPLILGRFKSHEELERAYQALDSEFGRRNQEWDGLRKEIAELRGAVTQPQQPQVQLTQEAVDWLVSDGIQENPVGALEWARQNDPSGALAQHVMRAWYAEDPYAANEYHLSSAFGGFQQQIGQSQQPLQEAALQQNMNRAFVTFASEAPDAVNLAEAMLAEATANPELLSPLQSGTHEDQMRVFRNLYRLAKAGQASTAQDAQAQATAQVDAEAEAARQAAFVATGSQTQEADVRSPQEKWLEEVFDPAAAQFYG